MSGKEKKTKEHEKIQAKAVNETESNAKALSPPPYQLKADGDGNPTPPDGDGNPGKKGESPTPLPTSIKAGMEKLGGVNLGDVKVFRNSPKPAKLKAEAYARGTEIHLGPGMERHLGHEAWHVVQQKQGRVNPTMNGEGGIAINDAPNLEKEADIMGAKALSIKPDVGSLPDPKTAFKPGNFGMNAPVQRKAAPGPLVVQKQDGSGSHGVDDPGFGDRVKKQFWYQVATTAEGLGLTNAARHMRHYLNNTGATLNVSGDAMLRDLPGLEERFQQEISLARDEANTRIEGGETEFSLTGERKNYYAHKGESQDWFFAIGGFTYWYTADVTAVVDGENVEVNMDITLHVFDRYNWDAGKSVSIAGVTVTDESLGRLHTVGLAQEYEVNGESSPRNETWTSTDGTTDSATSTQTTDDREGTRSDPGRERSSDVRQSRGARDSSDQTRHRE